MDKKTIVAVWCGLDSALLTASVHGVTMLDLTRKRVGPHVCLIPWGKGFDWLDLKESRPSRRCHPDQRVAMRDLVAEMGADIGILVQGDCGCIDRAEIDLARARITHGWESYGADDRNPNPRIKAGTAKWWLQVSDSDDWSVPKGAEELRRILKPGELDMRMRMALDRQK